jgi:hypothetical protein
MILVARRSVCGNPACFKKKGEGWSFAAFGKQRKGDDMARPSFTGPSFTGKADNVLFVDGVPLTPDGTPVLTDRPFGPKWFSGSQPISVFLPQDKEAREILSWWFTGQGQTVVLDNDPEWLKYM